MEEEEKEKKKEEEKEKKKEEEKVTDDADWILVTGKGPNHPNSGPLHDSHDCKLGWCCNFDLLHKLWNLNLTRIV